MTSSIRSSISIQNEEDLEPRGLRKSTESQLQVSRRQSNVSELSRFMSSVRNDRNIDNLEYEAYKNRPEPESILVDGVGKDVADEDDGAPPKDRGIAWVMALCSMLMVFATWGANAGFGVFLNYYTSHHQFPGATQYDFALIGGIIVFLAQSLAPFSGFVCQMIGSTPLFVVGIIVQTGAYVGASFATQIWHLYLAQGVFVGLSFVMLFIPVTFILPTWFDKRMATAMGITVCGSGLGGVVFSLSVNKLIDNTGDQRWALRMCAIVTGASAIVATCILRPRTKSQPLMKTTFTSSYIATNAKAMFNFKIFRRYPLAALCLWFLIILMTYIIVLFSLAPYAKLIGLTASQASNITAILNAAQVVGRPLMGYFGDNIGRNNLSTIVCFICSVLIFALWINAKTYGSLIAFAILIGLIIGVGSTMAQSMAADLVETPGHLPAAWSGLNISVGFFSLVSEVIALKLVNKALTRQYLHSQIFAGSCAFFAFALMLINREWLVRQKLSQRRDVLVDMCQQTQDLEKDDDREASELQLDTYNRLLVPHHFITRIFYPIRV